VGNRLQPHAAVDDLGADGRNDLPGICSTPVAGVNRARLDRLTDRWLLVGRATLRAALNPGLAISVLPLSRFSSRSPRSDGVVCTYPPTRAAHRRTLAHGHCGRLDDRHPLAPRPLNGGHQSEGNQSEGLYEAVV
jgi:hypothetical protein